MAEASATAGNGERIGKLGDPCVMVIFGAAGDLTRRKLIPALYNLAKQQLLSREFAIVGVARNEMSTDEFRKKMSEDIKQFATTQNVDTDLWEWFEKRLYYLTGDFGDKTLFQKLSDLLKQVDQDHTFAEKMLSAMRQKFGGHIEQGKR